MFQNLILKPISHRMQVSWNDKLLCKVINQGGEAFPALHFINLSLLIKR